MGTCNKPGTVPSILQEINTPNPHDNTEIGTFINIILILQTGKLRHTYF